MRYYIDTCIWRDYYENRSDKLRPIGEYAFQFLNKILRESETIIVSDLVIDEMKNIYSYEILQEILGPFKSSLLFIPVKSSLIKRVRVISKKHNIPYNDAFHALIAKSTNSTVVTRDKHFFELQYLVEVKTPEQLL